MCDSVSEIQRRTVKEIPETKLEPPYNKNIEKQSLF